MGQTEDSDKMVGDYRLLQQIANGLNYTSVYLAEHSHTKKVVAIKFDDFGCDHSGYEKRFRIDAEKIISVKHRNIVPFLDYGIIDNPFSYGYNRLPYLVMDYIDNGNIRQLYPKGSLVPPNMIIRYVRQIAEALTFLHNQNLFHLDIRPNNLLLDSNSNIFLSDFGIPWSSYSQDDRLARNDEDSYAYRAPWNRHFNGSKHQYPIQADDQYSLGVVVYEWLSGNVPFSGDVFQLMTSHLHEPPPLLRSKVPSIPQAVEDVVLKALAKEPKDRFENVMAFAEALERASQPPKPKFQPNNALGLQFGSYRLLQHLSSGPFGDVYLAEHVSLGSRAAIKVLHRGMDVEQFRRGVRRIARLNHPNIVRVIDSGIKDTIPFLVMDFASRGSLHDLHHYSQEQPLPLTTVVAYVKQAAAALQELHDYNIVPTLINPHDLLIGDNNEILFDSIDIALTSNEKELPAGNPGYYIAPEQMSGPTFPESNQYALALMAHEWLSGHKLTGNTIMPSILPGSKPLVPLHTLAPNIPQEVSDVIMKALSKEPKDRYSTIEDFANALEDASLPKEQTKTRVGQQFGKYRLIKRLGRGGFADVYQGRHVEMDTFAAIKVLHSQVYDQDEKRFLEEARTIVSLRHPNIIRVLDFGIEDETPYLVMDQANGTLRDRHPKGSLLPARTILPYIKQVAAALQYAHDQRRIHRDIKPENMLIGGRNAILLSDFGLATTVNTATYQHTKTIAGTAIYTAPEQFRGRAGFASDQYALGIVVYEWLCGTAPFTDGDFMQLGYQHGYEPIPSMREKIPSLSPDTERVVMIALAKDPKQRFATIQAFANAFAQACG